MRNKIERTSYYERNIIPFDNWLFLKLYIAKERQNEFLICYLKDIVEYLNSKYKFKYFFMRYIDDKDHIRFRINSDTKQLFCIYEDIIEFLKNAFKDGVISDIQISTYDREIERYGGLELLEIIEELFFIDSEIVKEIFYYHKNININKACLLSIYNYLDLFFSSMDEKISFLESIGVGKISVDSVLKNDKEEYLNFILSKDIKELKEINKILNNRQKIIYLLNKKIAEYKFDEIYKYNIIDSIIHLSNNRFIGVDRRKEKNLMELLKPIIMKEWYLKRSKI